jgi:hypothetical protein
MAEASKDRFLTLLASTALNGIDFVELIPDRPLDLRVHFINTVPVDEPGITATVTGGDRIPTVAVRPINNADWASDAEGQPLLTLHVEAIGDFSDYTLTIHSSKLDRFFNHTRFSFKALCPSDFDCAPPPLECPPPEGDLPPIDYLAKDFLSFKRALSDFSALRYPDWQERAEADFGMMFLEALAALADDLSYQQDRIAAEAALDTATQRRSVVQHARLVDYEPRPGTSASAVLLCNVSGGPLPAGVPVSAESPDGAPIPFEIGRGVADTGSYRVEPRWNYPIQPYWWDDAQRCLMKGATEMWVLGHGYGFYAGQAILIDTPGPHSADPPIRERVYLVEPPASAETTDPLFLTPGPNPLDPPVPTPVTRLVWRVEDALKFDHDLTRTRLGGNLVPATQGRRQTESFAIDTTPATQPQLPLAIVRTGANSSEQRPAWDYLHSLRTAPLAWLAQDDPEAVPLPEIRLTQQAPSVRAWSWTRLLLNAGEFEPVYTTTPASYRPIATNPDGSTHYDYDSDQGETIRFGNGVFGELPNPGDVFEVTYRIGAGAAGNVAADSIAVVDPAWAGLLNSVTNPFPAQGGAEPETLEQVRRLAPQAFRARQCRAVRAEDYEVEAERLPWVQQAGTAFRWTGSWLTVFTAVDPRGDETLSPERHTEVIHLLNRRRLAGYESYVPRPRYRSIDLRIWVCARAEAFQGDVEQGILESLGDSQRPSGSTGFFFADHFTFGSPLERSWLEAAIQSVFGVAGVLSIQYRQRGVVPNFIELPEVLPLATDEILRVDNDPNHPERGSIKVFVEGGK